MNARLLAGATALAALIAAPAVAQADTTVTAGPLKVRDYQMTILGTDGAQDGLTVLFNRTSGKSTQMHMYSFDQGVSVTPTSIKASLGRYGTIALSLRGAKATKGVVPAGCTGSAGTSRAGTMTGNLRFVADSGYFRTISAKSLKGATSTGGKIDCRPANGQSGGGVAGAGGPTLMVSAGEGEAMAMFTASSDSQTAMRSEDPAATAPATIMHMISAPGSGLAVAADNASATVKGITPFIAGSGTFSGDPFPGGATGTLGGDVVAHFDSIGDVAFGGDATLMG
jgi:hypothetical protein